MRLHISILRVWWCFSFSFGGPDKKKPLFVGNMDEISLLKDSFFGPSTRIIERVHITGKDVFEENYRRVMEKKQKQKWSKKTFPKFSTKTIKFRHF